MKLYAAIHFLVTSGVALAARKNIIIDTDIFSDVDDAGALLLAATSLDVNLLAVNVNYPSTFSALATSAILAHYGLFEVPIGIRRPLTNDTFFDRWYYERGEYAAKIAFHWSGGSLPWGHAEEAWDPVALYRKVLSEAEDDSVTIVSIGFFENLSGLLNSTADAYSDLSGRALVARKVSELVVMGGDYPSGYEFNFWGSNASLTAHVINTWEGRMVFLGFSVGEDVKSGGPLMFKGPDDPVRMAYIYYSYYTPRPSWDPLAMLYAMNGLGDLFKFGNEYGYNHVGVDGANRWVWDPESIYSSFYHTITAPVHMELTVHNNISIAQIIVFIPFLAVSIFLCVRHGFGQNAGWLFLVFFSLERIIGASLQLATIAQPDNIGLVLGVLTLQSVGLSDFIITLLALLNRALETMERARSSGFNPRALWWAQLLVFVGVILGAIGGPSSSSHFAKTGEYKASDLTQAGIGLTIAGFVLLVIATVVVGLKISYAEPGEKRIVLAVALSLPFLLVRVLYAAIGAYKSDSAFNLATGNINIFLGTAVIEEIIIVFIIEAVGLTLKVRPKTVAPSSKPGPLGQLFNRFKRRHHGYEMQSSNRNSDMASSLIIVTGFPTSGKSTRAKQLHTYLSERIQTATPSGATPKYRLHLISDQTLSISRSVYDLSALPAHTRSANASEKDARAAIYGAVKRVLSDKDIVILDGLNYIKGWRSDARKKSLARSTRRAWAENLRVHRDARKSGNDADEAEGAYEPANWENLVFRYEEPNPMTRWDSPLFTLIWEDEEEQSRKVFDSLWEAMAGETRKIVKPNQATVQRSRDTDGDYLYVLDRETQDIVKRILEQQSDEGGGEVRIPQGGGKAGDELVVELPGSKKVGLPQLQRLRRAFMGLNRGGIGLEGIGNMGPSRIRESFVGYLNDTFEKDG
ncbi:hypothetical protein NUW58_g1581 [Xylaria curta]|uniref:Uncharacterized protein n=1 Tax=Xylaria curta TaxID=42375 RepID=A0ACC1PJJ7_9PEZI|nr:hypothetical protein NUW58_g1581 [Xylaria curta]